MTDKERDETAFTLERETKSDGRYVLYYSFPSSNLGAGDADAQQESSPRQDGDDV
ncbi:MAG: hypothetical protein M3281_10075 [Chloroflexota bacterium]|nr:hypothetical protein [Chloroflexota bacterium]